MLKKRWLCIILIITILIISAIFYMINENKYYKLSRIVNVNMDDLYIRGRNNNYNKVINYVYGDKLKAAKLSDGSTANDLFVFYDAYGNEELKINFLGNQEQVTINNKKYLYKKNNNTLEHTVKELYPDKNKSKCEMILYDIIKLYNEDNEYMWDYYNEKNYDYPKEYINGVKFLNEGIKVVILEYKDNTINSDYIKECNRIMSWYGGKLETTFESDEIKVNSYLCSNKDFKYTVIKYNNIMISIQYLYDYREQNSIEVNNNIEIFNNYLKELNIIK